MTQTTQQQPAPIGGPADSKRSIDDRLGEALRRRSHGLIRPLWGDMLEANKQRWRDSAAGLQRFLKEVGLKIEIDE